MSHASEITRRAKSNLAIALRLLPAGRRDDMVVFYAFCRTIDDLADDDSRPAAGRAAELDAWEHGLLHGFETPDDFQREVVDLRDRHQLPTHLLTAIIQGCKSDLEPGRRFQRWEGDLEAYTWNVACAVGLISVRLFGCTDLAAAGRYATALGHALQLTNILRDVGEDLDHRRVYLPLDDLAACGYPEADLLARIHDARFTRVAEITAARAEAFFQQAERELPAADHAALAPARVMAAIYQELLHIIRDSGFRVLDHRHKVPKTRQLAILARHFMG
ncbi:MAG: phytoene/squalene synthase family protein [Luteolibacter sp.]|jgi:15-cis-phytoene synthase